MSDRAYEEAAALAQHLWHTHYRDTTPEFELFEDTPGVISQIDNMVAGIVEAANQQKELADRQRKHINNLINTATNITNKYHRLQFENGTSNTVSFLTGAAIGGIVVLGIMVSL